MPDAFLVVYIVVRSQQECIKAWQLAIMQHYPVSVRTLTEIRNCDPINYLASLRHIMFMLS